MTRRGDADFLPLSDQLADHAGAAECLPRARRTLNGEHGLIEVTDDPDGEIRRRFVVRFGKNTGAEARGIAANRARAAP